VLTFIQEITKSFEVETYHMKAATSAIPGNQRRERGVARRWHKEQFAEVPFERWEKSGILLGARRHD
jgi:hypothetical protein